MLHAPVSCDLSKSFLLGRSIKSFFPHTAFSDSVCSWFRGLQVSFRLEKRALSPLLEQAAALVMWRLWGLSVFIFLAPICVLSRSFLFFIVDFLNILLFLSLMVADACYLFTVAQVWGRTVVNVMWNVLFVSAEHWCLVLECCREERLICQTFPVGTGYPRASLVKHKRVTLG